MLPDDERLLRGMRGAIAGLTAGAAPGARATLEALDATLVELILRRNRSFYVDHFVAGVALLTAGTQLVAKAPPAQFSDVAVLGVMDPGRVESLPVDAIWERLLELRSYLSQLVTALSNEAMAARDAPRPWLRDVVDWETAFFARHAAFMKAEATAPKESPNRWTAKRIGAYLQQRFPSWSNLFVAEVQLLPGGFSKKTIMITVTDDPHGRRSLVIRAEQPPRFEFWQGDQVQNEFRVLQMAFEAGLPVPEPLWVETDTAHFGQPFLVTRAADGRNVGSAVGASGDISPAMIQDLIRKLVQIHNAPIARDDRRIAHTYLERWAHHATIRESTAAWVNHWIDCISRKQLRPSPLTERMMQWLKNNVPDSQEPTAFLHGDYGLHNALIQGESVSSILDWEYASFGDPAEDLAMLSLGLNGIMDRDRLIESYHALGGRPISEYRQRYFDVLYCMKFIVPSENALKLFQSDDNANLGLCRLGFHYAFPGAHMLNEKIARAEAVGNRR